MRVVQLSTLWKVIKPSIRDGNAFLTLMLPLEKSLIDNLLSEIGQYGKLIEELFPDQVMGQPILL